MLGIYYVTPLLQWDGRQAILFDLPARKFYLFGLTLWPQDFIYLAALLILAGFALFFFTALLGRVWCGYACPQTVWTEAYLWMERKIEGNRGKRMKLDKAPSRIGAKIRTKALKHTVWIAFSLWTGFTFVAYFTPIDVLAAKLITLHPRPLGNLLDPVLQFRHLRQCRFHARAGVQVHVPLRALPECDVRFGYADRRLPSGARRTARLAPAQRRPANGRLGDCIDCNVCVQVCPTGIDIRDGLQYECIACSACIDGCNEIMDKMKYPRGLISYTTENAALGKKQHIMRPRVMVYAAILLLLSGALLTHMLSQRVPLELDVIRDRNTLYRETSDGLIENVYTLKILNMDSKPHRYLLTASGIDGIKLVLDQARDRGRSRSRAAAGGCECRPMNSTSKSRSQSR